MQVYPPYLFESTAAEACRIALEACIDDAGVTFAMRRLGELILIWHRMESALLAMRAQGRCHCTDTLLQLQPALRMVRRRWFEIWCARQGITPPAAGEEARN